MAHRELNASCGDDLTLSLLIEDGQIQAVGWDGQGCAISQAGMSILGETLLGKTVEEAEAITATDMRTLLGVPIGPSRLKCALLALHALKNTLRMVKNEPSLTWAETLSIPD